MIKEYVSDSHFARKLLKHNPTGDLYFYPFYEKIDQVNGNDPQYRIYIPVNSIEEGDKINNCDMREIYKIKPRIIYDWKENNTVEIGWIK